jgi:hypothetical protein
MLKAIIELHKRYWKDLDMDLIQLGEFHFRLLSQLPG